MTTDVITSLLLATKHLCLSYIYFYAIQIMHSLSKWLFIYLLATKIQLFYYTGMRCC